MYASFNSTNSPAAIFVLLFIFSSVFSLHALEAYICSAANDWSVSYLHRRINTILAIICGRVTYRSVGNFTLLLQYVLITSCHAHLWSLFVNVLGETSVSKTKRTFDVYRKRGACRMPVMSCVVLIYTSTNLALCLVQAFRLPLQCPFRARHKKWPTLKPLYLSRPALTYVYK